MSASADAIILAIGGIIAVAGKVVKTAQDAAPFARIIYDTFFSGKPVTEAALAEMRARADEQSAILQAPLPPEEPDEKT